MVKTIEIKSKTSMGKLGIKKFINTPNKNISFDTITENPLHVKLNVLDPLVVKNMANDTKKEHYSKYEMFIEKTLHKFRVRNYKDYEVLIYD